MSNEFDQSKVAYESAPKEVNTHKPLAGSKKQFGKANHMPQENKGYKEVHYPANPVTRKFQEYR